VANYDAIINLTVIGESKITKVVNKLSQLESIVDTFNKTPIDFNASNAIATAAKFENKLKTVDEAIEKSSASLAKSKQTLDQYRDRLEKVNTTLQTSSPNTQKYNRALESQKKLREALIVEIQKQLQSEQKLEKSQLEKNNLVPLVEYTQRAKQATVAINKLASEYLAFGKLQIAGPGVDFSISQLASQAQALKLVANNAKIASAEFNRFTIASAVAEQSIFEARQKQLQALAAGFSPSGGKVDFGKNSISAARQIVTSLIDSYDGITKSEAALSSYLARLQELKALVPTISAEYSALEERIAQVRLELDNTGLRGQTSQITPRQGPATTIYSEKGTSQRLTYQKRLTEEQEKQFALSQRINRANLDDTQKAQLLLKLEQASVDLMEHRVDGSKNITRELDRERISLERANLASQRQIENAQKGAEAVQKALAKMESRGPLDPFAVSKTQIAEAEKFANLTAKDLAQARTEAEKLQQALAKLEARPLQDNPFGFSDRQLRIIEGASFSGQAKQSRISGKTAISDVSAPIDAPKRQYAIYQASEKLLEKLNGLELQGWNIAEEKLKVKKLQTDIEDNALNLSRQLLEQEQGILATVSRQIAIYQERDKTIKAGMKNALSSPIEGGVNFPGSPIYKQTPFLERRFGKRGSAAISEGLIGGAFPLLFGQGPLAALGGGLGGAAGGFAGGGLGFGLSLLGTGLGQAASTFAASAIEAGKSLRDPIANLQKLADAGLLASKSQEQLIKNLIEFGRSSEAATIIQQELAKKIGVLGLRDMADLGDASTRLSKAWAELTVQLQAAIAGPLAGLLEWTASIVALAAGGNRKAIERRDFLESLPPDKRKELLNRLASDPYGASNRSEASIFAEYEKFRKPLALPPANVSPEQKQADFEKQLQLRREEEDRAYRNAKEIEDLKRETISQQRQFDEQSLALQRQSWDLQRRVNDDIFNKQQQIQQQQISLDRAKKQIAIETVDIEYQRRIANEEGRAAEVLAAEAELMRVRSTNEAEIESKKRMLELDIAKQKRETENYVYQLARDADGIRRATLKYELDVADYKYKREQQIEEINRRRIREDEDAINRAISISGSSDGSSRSNRLHISRSLMNGLGLTAEQAAGVVGNLMRESGVNPRINEGGAVGLPRGIGGYGIAQWTGSRQTDLVRFAGSGANAGNLNTQIAFLIKELQTSEARSLRILRTAQTADQAAYLFDREFERSGIKAMPERIANARQALLEIKGSGLPGATPPAPQLPPPAGQISLPSANAVRPQIASVSPSVIRQRQGAMDAQGAKIQQEEVALQEKLAKLQEQAALERLLQAAAGKNQLKQSRDELAIAQARLNSIGSYSQEQQELLTFEAESVEKVRQREELDKKILADAKQRKKLNEEDLNLLKDKLKVALEAEKAQIEVDKQKIMVAQQARFKADRASLEMQLRTQGAGVAAGFYGSAAQRYVQEMQSGTGDAAKAANLAQLQKQLDFQGEIIAIKESLNQLNDPMHQVKEGAKAIGSAFGDSFKGVVSGSMTAQEALANFFQRTADHFLEMAAQMLAQQTILRFLNFGMSFFGGGGGLGSAVGAGFGGVDFGAAMNMPSLTGLATGGPANANTPYIIGEKGPELFVPRSSGTVVPNHALGGDSISVTVNVDANGSTVQGDDQRANELGRLVSAAVQRELIKQKRSGGILAK